MMLTVSVPQGSAMPSQLYSRTAIRYRETDPSAPPAAIAGALWAYVLLEPEKGD